MPHWKRYIWLGRGGRGGGNRKWVFWWAKHRSGIFDIIIQNGLSKIIQRICNLVFHILWKLCVQVLKNYEDKAKRQLLTFVSMSLICPISNGMFPSQSVPKVLLEPKKDFIFIMELYKLNKFGRKSTKGSLQSKTETLYVWNNDSKLALKNYILWGFRGKIRRIHWNYPKTLFLEEFGFCDLGQSRKTLT